MYQRLFDEADRIPAADFEANAYRMNFSGLYLLRSINIKEIDDNILSDDKLSNLLENRGHDILYAGKAANTLTERLEQELRAFGPGTFFRSVGAIIGKMPVQGCLIGARNTNYVFSATDKNNIITWINKNVYISWIKEEKNIVNNEIEIIKEIKPAFNFKHNMPFVYSFLKQRRKACIDFARS